jgi:hypothetical protein
MFLKPDSADLQSVPTSESRQYKFKKLQQILLDRFTCQLARGQHPILQRILYRTSISFLPSSFFF